MFEGTLHGLSSLEPTVTWVLGRSGLAAAQDPEQIAVKWENGERSYAELRDRSLRLAQSLRARGLTEGDRVATFVFNRGETFELYFACAYAGLTFVPIGFRLTSNEVAQIIEDCSPKAIFSQAELAPTMTAALEATGLEVFHCVLENDASGSQYEDFTFGSGLIEEFRHTDIQLVLYTSGTTGRPKGVAFRHMNILWFALQQASLHRRLDNDSVTLIIAPTYNTGGINEQSIPTFLVGGTVAVLPSRGWSARRMAGFMNEWGATHCVIFPSMFKPMLDADDEKPLGLESLRWVLAGGENCPPAIMQAFRDRWPHIWLNIAYGSTESGVATFIEDKDTARHPGSVGRVAPGQSIAIVGVDGEQASPGEVGEVWTAGPSVVSSYWNAPEIDADTIHDGWLRIGDLGRIDGEGYLYVEGRAKDLIISKGQNIYPAEIENVLKAHPELADSTVLGVPDAEFGEAVCAVVVRVPGSSISEGQVIAHVRESLASYKKPRHVLFHTELPRNATQKVLKGELLDWCIREMKGEDLPPPDRIEQ